MPFVDVLTCMAASSASICGVGLLERTALRTLMVLPKWPLAGWQDWQVVGLTCGAVTLVVLGASVMLQHRACDDAKPGISDKGSSKTRRATPL